MEVHDLKPAPGSKKARRRVGRGIAGKGGKTAGRGHQGHRRAEHRVAAYFEGGQTPIHWRTPKAKGFRNPFRVEYVVVNLDMLESLDLGSVIDPGILLLSRSRPRSTVSSRSSAAASSTWSLTVRGPCLLAGRNPGHRGRRGTGRDDPGTMGRWPPTGSRNASSNR